MTGFASAALRRIALAWFPAACLVASALMSGAPARAQDIDSARTMEVRGFKFALSGPDWHQTDYPTDPTQLKSFISLAHAEPLHEQDIAIFEPEMREPLSQAEVTAQRFATERKIVSSGWGYEWSEPSTRTINGITYPVINGRRTPSTGTPIGDFVELVYFPPDFDQRHRYFVLLWRDTHSTTVSAKDLTELDAVVSSITIRPVGEVLLSDDFADAAAGVLPESSPDPDHYQRGYIDGEYVLQKVDPDWDGVAFAFAPGTFANTTVAADVRLVSESTQPLVGLACRVDPKNSRNQYRLVLAPDDGRFRFLRDDDGQWKTLVNWQTAPSLLGGGETNHVELTCAGATFSATVNGQAIFQVRDTAYREGRLQLLVEGTNAMGEARFSNLVVTQR